MTAPHLKATKPPPGSAENQSVVYGPVNPNTTTQSKASARFGNTTKPIAPLVAPAKAKKKKPVAAEPATDPKTTNGEFAQPSGWGDLWRVEPNGPKYYFWRIKYTDSADVPPELRRVTRPGGKITPEIQALIDARPGRGRHATSRINADRLRGRAIAIAKHIRSSPRSGTSRKARTDSNAGRRAADAAP